MLTQDVFFGGAQFLSISANKTLSFASGKVCCVDATVGALNVKTPSARQLRLGGYQGVVINVGSNAFSLQDNGGTLLKTMNPGDAVELYCLEVVTTAGKWAYRQGVAGSSPEPAVDFYGYVIGAQSNTNSNDVREYRNQTDVWNIKADFPVSGFVSLGIVDGAVCVIGAKGYVGGFSSGSPTGFKKALLQYDPDVWTRKTDCPNDLEDCGGDSFDDIDGFFFNGSTGGRDTHKYVAGADSWTQGVDRPADHAGSCVGLATSTKIVLQSGQQQVAAFDYVDTYVWDAFTAKATRPGVKKARDFSTVLSGYVWSHCGESPVSPPGLLYDDVQKYYEPTDTWTYMADFAYLVCNGSCFTVDGKMFLAGGNSVWQVGPSSTNFYLNVHGHVDTTDTYFVAADLVSNISAGTALGRGITP